MVEADNKYVSKKIFQIVVSAIKKIKQGDTVDSEWGETILSSQASVTTQHLS